MKRNQLIQFWKNWMNRNRSFSKPEMEELESHLWEEMDEMVVTEGCAEEEAFHQVIDNIGNRNAIHSEFKKSKRFSMSKINSCAHDHLWQLVSCLMTLLILIISDSVYANTHYQEKIEVMQEGISQFESIVDQLEQKYSGLIGFPPSLHETDFVISDINAISKGIIYSDPMYLNFVYDEEGYLWISSLKTFNKKTKKVKINPPRKIVEHRYSYRNKETKLNENPNYNNKTDSFSIKSLNEDEGYWISFYIDGLNKGQAKAYYRDKSLSSFLLTYDDHFNTIHTKNINSFFMNDGSDEDILIEIDNDVFFSELERSTYFIYKEDNLSYFFRIELMEIQPKTTTTYDFPFNSKPMLVQNTTVEDKRVELHWNLLKNVKEPIHLYQAILTSIQKFFKVVFIKQEYLTKSIKN